jgi:hypothetical protein
MHVCMHVCNLIDYCGVRGMPVRQGHVSVPSVCQVHASVPSVCPGHASVRKCA